MKINVISTGRSHLLDVSISLIENGHDVTFYTAIPKSRCEKFGLPKENVVSFFWIIGWLFIHRKFSFKYKIKPFLISVIDYLFDLLTSIFLTNCDVFIGGSVFSTRSSKVAKEKFGSLILIDCGTKHVLEQDAVLKNIPGSFKIYEPVIKNELRNYQYADRIVVPSHHAYDSFIKYGFKSEKIFINPYGVDTKMFKPTIKLESFEYDVIFVGAWRYIKGSDLLVDSCINKLGLRLLHVGSIFGDLKLPISSLFTHIDPVPQQELIKYYSKSRIFVLPSRAEGLALVQAQAMLCGLPVVYSYHTGGSNLVELVGGSDYMFMISDMNSDAIAESIKLALCISDDQLVGRERNYLGSSVDNLTWDSYGKRYTLYLNDLHKLEKYNV
jgi:glycosyltransferase involved in cell wall biosynthesis